MIEELASANKALDAALARYLQVCTNIKCFYSQRTADITPQLAARLDAEISCYTSFETRLKESCAAVCHTKAKHTTSLASVNKLPAEVLVDIFYILVDHERHEIDKSIYLDRGCRLGPGEYPNILTSVCSHWRAVAMQSRRLWAHVDLTTLQANSMNTRAKLHIDRAGQAPLAIFVDDSREPSNEIALTERYNAISSIIPPSTCVHSLYFRTSFEPADPVRRSVLSSCISACTAGALKKLLLKQVPDSDYPVSLVEAAGSPLPNDALVTDETGESDFNIVRLNVPKERLEEILLGVTILRCQEMYPYWTSKAYCGLTELRLAGADPDGYGIDEIYFVNMLKSSPNLRVLKFNLTIINTAPAGVIPIRDMVSLHSLEVLNLPWQWNEHQTDIVLRWFAPVLKPLQVSIICDGDINFGDTATKAFLTGSNITRLHTTFYSEDLDHGPHEDILSVRTHTLAILDGDLALERLITGLENNPEPYLLDTLFLIKGSSTVDKLRRLLELSPIKHVTTHCMQFDIPNHEIPPALAHLCADITILPSEAPDPIEDWELFTPQ